MLAAAHSELSHMTQAYTSERHNCINGSAPLEEHVISPQDPKAIAGVASCGRVRHSANTEC